MATASSTPRVSVCSRPVSRVNTSRSSPPA
ncbi:Uncharacterised protein [Bordetella pertussis]|nr:Uncharacterised protein [Bordetella pertussis]